MHTQSQTRYIKRQAAKGKYKFKINNISDK